MLSIRQTIFDKWVQTVFPANSTKPCKVANFSVEKFKRNYIFEKCKSLTTGCTAYVFCALAIKDACCGHTTYAVAKAVTSIAFIYVWNHWGNQEYEWVIQASKAMRNQNEKEALACIERGANISQYLNSYPTLFPFIFYKVPFNNSYSGYLDLFDQAVKTNCSEVLQCLSSLGHNVNKDASYLGSVKNLETAKLLCDMGADVNLRVRKQLSPLGKQFQHLTKDELRSYSERLSVIEFLVKKKAIIEEYSLEKNIAVIGMVTIMRKSTDSLEDAMLLNSAKATLHQISKELSKNWQTRPSF